MSAKTVQILKQTYSDCWNEGLTEIAKYAISRFDWGSNNSVHLFKRSLKFGIEHYGVTDPEYAFPLQELKTAFTFLDKNIRKYK